MMMENVKQLYDKYEAVRKFPILKAYLEYFERTSISNPIPGLLSFFLIQGQIAVPYVRIPMGDTYLDPRVHCFWIQASRSGKSIAWNFIGDILSQVGAKAFMFTTGTDAGLIGTYESIKDSKGEHKVKKIGLLDGHKTLNFDEGSILLNPGKHSQETILYLQTACNPVGTENNKLVKHMADGIIEAESLVSLWITTYPPKGVKDYVLTRGIFQRVLLFRGEWGIDKRQDVSNKRLSSFFKKSKDSSLDKQEIIDYFKQVEERLIMKISEIGKEITGKTQWDCLDREEQEKMVQDCMWDMFTVDEDFETALHQVVDDYYEIVRNMDASLMEVVASFVVGIENYLGIFAVHFALLDKSWCIKGEYVDMAHEILYDLFKNLVTWLEDEVEVGLKEAQKAQYKNKWIEAYNNCESFSLEERGDNWRRMATVFKQYETLTQKANITVRRHYNTYGKELFTIAQEGRNKYIRLKVDKK